MVHHSGLIRSEMSSKNAFFNHLQPFIVTVFTEFIIPNDCVCLTDPDFLTDDNHDDDYEDEDDNNSCKDNRNLEENKTQQRQRQP